MKQIKATGFVKNSFVDWPGKISSVIFFSGCNFTCHYCHNNHVLGIMDNTIPLTTILSDLKERVGFIDGVVISGGEPTIQTHLKETIDKIRKLGLPIKLDTNGTNPELLKELIESGKVDYVAMDVKAPLHRYADISAKNYSLYNVQYLIDQVAKSIKYLKAQTRVDYMFRTTLSPMLTMDDIKALAQLVKGAKCLQLQQYVPNEFSKKQPMFLLPYTKADAEKFGEVLSKEVNKFIMRGFG